MSLERQIKKTGTTSETDKEVKTQGSKRMKRPQKYNRSQV